MIIHFCSMLGDISIKVDDANKENILLETNELSEGEKNVVKSILKEYNIFPEEGIANQVFVIANKKMEDVHKLIKKLLKKDRPTLTAVKYKDGRIECVEELRGDILDAETGATVEKPRTGCPMPIMLRSEIRASKVLKEFLSEKQLSDFNKYLQFVSIGNNSGKPYLVTSRWCEDVEKHGQLYDIVDKRVICANCMEIPPSEECLSLKLAIEFKESEFLNTSLVETIR